MDALNPIANSAAGTPLAGQSVTTNDGQRSVKLTSKPIRDTLETSDREADGSQQYTTSGTKPPRKNADDRAGSDGDKPEQGTLLDLEG